MTNKQDSFPISGVFRRLAALVYDLLLLCAIWACLTVIVLLSLFGGEAPQEALKLQLTILPLNIISTYLFYAWCWTHGGQTLGMQAWRIRTVTAEGKQLNLKESILRSTLGAVSFVFAGLGYWIAFVDPNKLSLHDRLSKTRVILLPPNKRK